MNAAPVPRPPAIMPKLHASEVFDSFYELLVYEAIETLIARHNAK